MEKRFVSLSFFTLAFLSLLASSTTAWKRASSRDMRRQRARSRPWRAFRRSTCSSAEALRRPPTKFPRKSIWRPPGDATRRWTRPVRPSRGGDQCSRCVIGRERPRESGFKGQRVGRGERERPLTKSASGGARTKKTKTKAKNDRHKLFVSSPVSLSLSLDSFRKLNSAT